MARGIQFDRIRVLDRALELFWTRGYTSTSMQDLVDRLELNRSSIYNAFGDKRGLFIECLERYRQKQVRGTLDMVDASDDPLEAVRSIFEMVIKADIGAAIPKGCFMVNSSVELGPHDQAIAEILRADARDTREALFRAVKKGQEMDRISKTHDARALAAFLQNNIRGMRVAVKSRSDESLLNDVMNVIMSVLTNED